MIFITIVGLVVYFILPFWFVLWICYEKFDISIDPIFTALGLLILELSLFAQFADPFLRIFNI